MLIRKLGSLVLSTAIVAIYTPDVFGQGQEGTPEVPSEGEPSQQPRIPEETPAEQPPQPPQQPQRPPAATTVRPTPVDSTPRAQAPAEDPENPVVRAQADNWGMFFRFGGLATLLAGGNSRTVGTVVVTQVGFKKVLSEELMIPFSFGMGVRHLSEEVGEDSITDFGIDLNVGFEYHFRIWRRISPFVGASIGLGASDPTGSDNLVIGIGLGPNVGVEYYVADRVSLTAQYLLVFQFQNGQLPGFNEKITAVEFSTMSGGAMNLTYYF